MCIGTHKIGIKYLISIGVRALICRDLRDQVLDGRVDTTRISDRLRFTDQ